MLQQINTENFQQMLSQFSTGELESMIEKFPYFEQAHVLLAKKYQQENSPKFDQQLQLAALYIQDRELLYNLFNDRNAIVPSVEAELVKTVEPQEGQREIVTQQQNTEPVTVTELPTEQKETQEQTTTTETPETAIALDQDAIALALEEIKKTMGAIQQISEAAKIEEAVETEPLVYTEKEEIQEPISVKEIPDEEIPVVTEIKEEVQTVLATPAVEEVTEDITEEVAEEESVEQVEPLEVFSRIAPHTFDEWLQAFNNKNVSKAPEKVVVNVSKKEDEELTQLYAANVTSDYLHGIVKEETNYAKGLERFIEDQIQKHKQPEKKRKDPKIQPDNELITETMAKVYEMQKKYALAIKAYEALTLKFPEKSSLFAARIDLLKNIH